MNRLFLFLLCNAALAAPPMLTELQPRGAQQGKAFTLSLQGRALTAGAKIISTLPAVFTPLSSSGKSLPFLVEMKQEAAVGTYPVRVQTPDGISNILLFTVGAFPEIEEEETVENSNDSITGAQVVKSTPVTINGKLQGADRDRYRVSGKAGERRVFEVEARRCGSAIDPVLSILDMEGNQLARSDDAQGIGVDARIDYTFPREGNYIVEIHDARFSKQEQNFYRLKIGSYSYPQSAFPLGGKRGESVDIEFRGNNQGTARATVKLPETGDFALFPMPGSPALPLRFALSGYPELREPVEASVVLPAVINGRIAKPAEVDRYRVEVKPGESLLLELQARELDTSRLDGLITVYDGSGKKLVAAGDTTPPPDVFAVLVASRTSNDPFLNFKVPPDVHEITVAVEDIARRGGPDYGYRLTLRKQAEDFLVSTSAAYVNVPRGSSIIIPVSVDRRGFDGPVHASIPDLPKGWIAEGGYIAEETVDPANQRSVSRRGVMTLTAQSDAELPAKELVVFAEGKLADGSVLRRRASGPGTVIDVAGGTGLMDPTSTDRQKPFMAPWLGMALPVGLTSPSSAILQVKATGRTPMEQGDAYQFEWTIESGRKDLIMPAAVTVDTPGVRDVRVINMKPAATGAATGSFTVTTTKATTPARYDLIVSANLMLDGQRETIYSRAIPFEVLEGGVSDSTSKVPAGGR
ncbi:MAG TPA: hypothetical protein VMZ52_19390 [Bryobacteraceae bacterium]|nr:hypothetical protein [Bryobacteraceae bacterium]